MPPDPDDATATAPPPRRRNRGRALLLTLVSLAVLAVLFYIFTGLYTDLLWFRSVGPGDGFVLVFQTELKIRLLMFVVFGGLMAAAVAVNCWIAGGHELPGQTVGCTGSYVVNSSRGPLATSR